MNPSEHLKVVGISQRKKDVRVTVSIPTHHALTAGTSAEDIGYVVAEALKGLGYELSPEPTPEEKERIRKRGY